MNDDSVITNLPLIICDGELKQTSRVTNYTSFSYTERWGGRDSFSLTLPRNAPHAEELLIGRIMIIPVDRHHDNMRAVHIKQIQVSDEEITVSGNDYLWDLLECRVVLANTQTTDDGIDKQENQPAETAARHYITVNIITPVDGSGVSDPPRGDPVISLETPAGTRGEKVTIEGRLQTLAEVMESICEQSGIHTDDSGVKTNVPSLGVYGVVVEDSSARGWHIEVRFRLGIDHSQTTTVTDTNWVVLSESMHNIRISNFSNTLPDGNLIIVAGSGTGKSRPMKYVGDITLHGVSRREKYCTASDCKTPDEMEARGKEELEKAKSLTVEASLVNPYIYARDFGLGDIVTVDMGRYGAYNIRVSEATIEYTADAVSVDVTLGAELKGIVRTIRDTVAGEPLRRQ